MGPPAGVLVELRGVLGQEGLAESLAGAVGERGDRVGAHPEHRRDVGGLVALHLGVPQHELPALGEAGEGSGGGGALEALDSRVAERHARVEGLHVVGRVQPGPGPEAVDLEPPYRGQQVGAEGEVGAAAALQHPQHLDERLGHEVLGVPRGDELAREPTGRVDVALEERAVGIEVPAAHRRDQLGVAGRLDAGGHAHGWTLMVGRFREPHPTVARPSDCIPGGASTAPESEETETSVRSASWVVMSPVTSIEHDWNLARA